jgi:hypothetical protein
VKTSVPVARCRTRAPRQNSWLTVPTTKALSAKQMPDAHTRTPRATTAIAVTTAERHGDEELIAKVDDRGLAPRQQRPDAR